MRKGNLLIVVLMALTLIIGTASADIKGVKKEIDNNDQKKIQITTSDNVQRISDGTNNQYSYSIINGEKKWERIITPEEDSSLLDIKADGTLQLHINGGTSGNGGCLSREGYNSHTIPYSLANVNLINTGLATTYHLDTTADSNHQNSGVIGICIYPTPYNDPTLTLLYNPNEWEIKHNTNWDYFGFGRHNGQNYIPLGTDYDLGKATYMGSIPNTQNILLHILDPVECGSEGNTCWRRPDPGTQIPEFPTVALPIAAIIGLVFLFQHRKKKSE